MVKSIATQAVTMIAMIARIMDGLVELVSNEAHLFKWDGTDWKTDITIEHPQNFIVRGDLSFTAADDGWLLMGGPLDNEPAQTIAYHFDGSQWKYFSTITDPNAASVSAMIFWARIMAGRRPGSILDRISCIGTALRGQSSQVYGCLRI